MELDIKKPIPISFLQKIGKGGVWIQFCYERLAKFCYNCGMIGHGKASYDQPFSHNQIISKDLYDPWLMAEADVFTMVSEGNYLRKVEISRGEIFDTFSDDTNTNDRDEENVAQVRVSDANKLGTMPGEDGESTQNIVRVNVEKKRSGFSISSSTIPAPIEKDIGPNQWAGAEKQKFPKLNMDMLIRDPLSYSNTSKSKTNVLDSDP
ncbi:hypothetical protein FEM48_Zijuj03G0102000 [Ziziphus jujuba var. spinosa]|uniref:Zinc knuckle CX2CX4HX4C domain-containing protein n=1 Tax=Ziziphus jujuba var. spinosa TaxID=714518 RepID=A0A978VPP7_ZIZJJ|nr:hypothetical protein FEM48_Zijuj03G0102000 [Ziziphus jujuba var. spinosa]